MVIGGEGYYSERRFYELLIFLRGFSFLSSILVLCQVVDYLM